MAKKTCFLTFNSFPLWVKSLKVLYLLAGLATVIGLKYASPAKEDGKRTLKVKSYVSDEYKELVDHAALH